MNSAGPDKTNDFKLLDYEVYGIDYKDKDNIYKICQYPDVIWEYITTYDISDETLKQFDNELSLLKDLDRIHCTDERIRSNITNYYLREKSELFPTSKIITKKYDEYFKQWLGKNIKYKIRYRSSTLGFSNSVYHLYCDKKRSKLVVIRTTEGYIFGGLIHSRRKKGNIFLE